ncbi:hypothetical protein [Gimesia sp.]|uniref:hypothetical protein n=1 Tax=Gimesia sp. TaxID=2024833 RepID=UPI000C3BAE04|nr:hypothetical protein [Gimesia sp.]MAX38475.1 hypothetical protein [Gimesia sp.]HAH43296.1 hypothetical protein [Planctomycetaceae bacterium]HBL43773.1 hypothetical protein [Planctomycetaceae bacterium]|tara:strand:- start:3964 stop:4413 length:450 start_codon:yes stop_codon:yes gene_type:complete
MLIRITCCVLLLLSGSRVAKTCEPLSDTDKSSLSVRLYEQNERPKGLAEFTILFADNEEIHYLAGGELPAAQGETPLEFGVKLTGKLKPLKQKRFRAALKLEVGERVDSADPQTQLVRTETLEIRSNLERGVKKRIHCGGKQWLELLLE